MRKTARERRALLPVYKLIYELGEWYGRKCEVCLKVMRNPMPGFTFHHLEYKKGEKTHKNFLSRERYYTYLQPIILRSPERFAFLCNACHHSLDGPRGLNRRKRMNVLRLFLMWFRTNT